MVDEWLETALVERICIEEDWNLRGDRSTNVTKSESLDK
jgi:hypothetical protein